MAMIARLPEVSSFGPPATCLSGAWRIPPSPASPALRHVESLDGLRALALVSVMLHHAGVPGMTTGWMGVDLFFVLSGFLITTLMVREIGQTGRVSLPKFWGRRFLRLMPAYWLYAGIISYLILISHWGWTGVQDGCTTSDYLRSIWLYYSNYSPIMGIWQYQRMTTHLWSLAVEEQFYFLWPILFVVSARRRLTEALAWSLLLAMVAICYDIDRIMLPFRLYTRGMGIMMGCAFALTAARSPGLRRCLQAPAARVSVLGLCLMSALIPGVLVQAGHVNESELYFLGCLVFDVAVSLLVSMLWYGSPDGIAKALSWRPLVYFGKISYGIYLYHMMVHYLVWSVLITGLEHWNRGLRYGLRLSLYLSLTVALASLSYYALERPFLRLKANIR